MSPPLCCLNKTTIIIRAGREGRKKMNSYLNAFRKTPFLVSIIALMLFALSAIGLSSKTKAYRDDQNPVRVSERQDERANNPSQPFDPRGAKKKDSEKTIEPTASTVNGALFTINAAEAHSDNGDYLSADDG